MNGLELKCEIIRHGFTMGTFAKEAGMSKKSLYYKMSGKSSFKQEEIQRISEILKLDGDKIISIFFDKKVS